MARKDADWLSIAKASSDTPTNVQVARNLHRDILKHKTVVIGFERNEPGGNEVRLTSNSTLSSILRDADLGLDGNLDSAFLHDWLSAVLSCYVVDTTLLHYYWEGNMSYEILLPPAGQNFAMVIYESRHYVAYFVDVAQRVCLRMDSLSNAERQAKCDTTLRRYLALVDKERSSARTWRIYEKPVCQQKNADDCGLHAGINLIICDRKRSNLPNTSMRGNVLRVEILQQVLANTSASSKGSCLPGWDIEKLVSAAFDRPEAQIVHTQLRIGSSGPRDIFDSACEFKPSTLNNAKLSLWQRDTKNKLDTAWLKKFHGLDIEDLSDIARMSEHRKLLLLSLIVPLLDKGSIHALVEAHTTPRDTSVHWGPRSVKLFNAIHRTIKHARMVKKSPGSGGKNDSISKVTYFFSKSVANPKSKLKLDAPTQLQVLISNYKTPEVLQKDNLMRYATTFILHGTESPLVRAEPLTKEKDPDIRGVGATNALSAYQPQYFKFRLLLRQIRDVIDLDQLRNPCKSSSIQVRSLQFWGWEPVCFDLVKWINCESLPHLQTLSFQACRFFHLYSLDEDFADVQKAFPHVHIEIASLERSTDSANNYDKLFLKLSNTIPIILGPMYAALVPNQGIKSMSTRPNNCALLALMTAEQEYRIEEGSINQINRADRTFMSQPDLKNHVIKTLQQSSYELGISYWTEMFDLLAKINEFSSHGYDAKQYAMDAFQDMFDHAFRRGTGRAHLSDTLLKSRTTCQICDRSLLINCFFKKKPHRVCISCRYKEDIIEGSGYAEWYRWRLHLMEQFRYVQRYINPQPPTLRLLLQTKWTLKAGIIPPQCASTPQSDMPRIAKICPFLVRQCWCPLGLTCQMGIPHVSTASVWIIISCLLTHAKNIDPTWMTGYFAKKMFAHDEASGIVSRSKLNVSTH
jgi:hypothetical protein